MLSFTVAFVAVACDSCNEDPGTGDGGDGSVPEIETVTPPAPVLEMISSKELIIGDSYYLSPTIKNIDGDVSWTSSDPTVATVKGGVVDALKKGETIITASYGEIVRTCKVEVDFCGLLPDISTVSGIDENVDGIKTVLVTGSEYSISPYVIFNNKAFRGEGAFTFTSSATDVLTVDNNGIISPLSVGTATITMDCTWRGLETSKQFDVEVRSNVNFFVDNGVLQNVLINTIPSFMESGDNYVNTLKINPSVSVNKATAVPVTNVLIKAIDKTVSYNYDKTSTIFTANTFGTVLVELSYYHEADDITYKANFEITAERPEKTIVQSLEQFCAIGGIYKDSNQASKTLVDYAWGESANVTLHDAYQDGEDLIIDGEKIYGVVVSNNDFTDTAVTIGSLTEVYNISLSKAAGYYLYTKEDVYDCFQLGNRPVDSVGYIVMMNDIDLEGNVTGATPITNSNLLNVKLSATFDGKGHVFNNVYINGSSLNAAGKVSYTYGFFGPIKSGSVLKNFAMINVKTVGYNSRSGIVSGADSDGSGLTLENIYFDFNADITLKSGLFEQFRGKMINVVINARTAEGFTIEDYVAGANMTTGASPIVRTTKKLLENATLDNVYLVSKKPVYYHAEKDANKLQDPTFDASGNITARNDWFLYGENETKLHYVYDYFTRTTNGLGLDYPTVQNTINSDTTLSKTVVIENIRRYDSYAEIGLDKDSKNVGNIEVMKASPYWSDINGTPVFTAVYENQAYYNESYFAISLNGNITGRTTKAFQGSEYAVSVSVFGNEVSNVSISGDSSKVTVNGLTFIPKVISANENDYINLTVSFEYNSAPYTLSLNVLALDPYQLTVGGEVFDTSNKLVIDGEYTLGVVTPTATCTATFTSSDTNVLQVVNGNKFKAVGDGSSTITATISESSGTIVKTFVLTVYDPILDSGAVCVNGTKVSNGNVNLVLNNEYTVSVNVPGIDLTGKISLAESGSNSLSFDGAVIKPIKYAENVLNRVNVTISYNGRTYTHLYFDVTVTHTCVFSGQWVEQSASTLTQDGIYTRKCDIDGCNEYQTDNRGKVEVSSLVLTQAPSKSQYEMLEAFDKTGMILTATGVDNTTADVTELATIDCEPFTHAGNYTVTISFGGKSVTVEVSVIDDSISVTEALNQEIGAEVSIKGYFVGVTNFNQDDRLEDGTYTNTYLLVKDTENDNIIAIRHEFAKFVVKKDNTDPWETNIGYVYGDLIILKGTVTAGDEYNTGLLYLDYSATNPENPAETIVSRGNMVSYNYNSAVVLDEWSDWDTAFTNVQPMTLIRITGSLSSVRSCSSYAVHSETDTQARMRTRETRIHMASNPSNATAIKAGGKYITLIDNVMTTNLGGSSWTEMIPFGDYSASANWAAAAKATKDVDIFVLYTGSDSIHHQVVVLQNSWFDAASLTA